MLRKVPKRLTEPAVLFTRRRFAPKQDHRNVELAMRAASRELGNRGETIPPEPELRSLVRRVFRMSRRSGTAPSVRDMICRPKGAHFLAWFISKQTRRVSSTCTQGVELSEVEPRQRQEAVQEEVVPQKQEAEPISPSYKANAEATVQSHPRLQQLKSSFRTLDPVERAEYVSEICRSGKRLIRKLAWLLRVDPGTIRRALAVAKLTAEQKADIRNGKSVSSVLEAANCKSSKPRTSATAEEKIGGLQAEIIQFLDHLDLGPGFSVQILDCAIEALPS